MAHHVDIAIVQKTLTNASIGVMQLHGFIRLCFPFILVVRRAHTQRHSPELDSWHRGQESIS